MLLPCPTPGHFRSLRALPSSFALASPPTVQPHPPLASCSYRRQLDVAAALPSCRTLQQLQALLARLAGQGRLAELAGALARNPLSLLVHRPPLEACTEVSKRGHCIRQAQDSCARRLCKDDGLGLRRSLSRRRPASGPWRVALPASPPSVRCCNGPRLKRVAAHDHAAFVEKPPLSVQASLAAARTRYPHVKSSGKAAHAPWGASLSLPRMCGGSAAVSLGLYGTAAQVGCAVLSWSSKCYAVLGCAGPCRDPRWSLPCSVAAAHFP